MNKFNRYPTASKVLERDFYVDYVATAADTLEEAVQMQHQLILSLRAGYLELGKYSSNYTCGVSNIMEDESNISTILGIIWNYAIDTLIITFGK